MKRKTTIGLGIAAGAVVLLGAAALFVGPIVYRDLIAGPAGATPTLTTGTGDATGTATLSADDVTGELSVASGSWAGYRVDEVLNGTDVTVTGRTEQVSGTVTAEAGRVTAAEVTVRVADITTDQPRRDAYFRDRALRTAEHPTATFELTEPFDVPTTGSATTEVTGRLTLAGETRTVTATVAAGRDGSSVQAAGSVPVTFEDFGVTAPSLGFVEVEPTGSVEFQLRLERA